MSISPSNLLQLSKVILATAKSEVEFRNAVGRAYYAAYHAANAFHDSLSSPGEPPSTRMGMHLELAYRLSRPTIASTDPRFKKSRDLGQDLNWLHGKRLNADYDLHRSVTLSDAEAVVERAEAAIELIGAPK
jgi:uncharacterized protein (UPF0332 family)